MKQVRVTQWPLLICFMFEDGVVHYFRMAPEDKAKMFPDAPRAFDVDTYSKDGVYLGRFHKIQLPSVGSARNTLNQALQNFANDKTRSN